MLSFFPLGVLDEIWDLNQSVSKGFFPTLILFGHADSDFYTYCQIVAAVYFNLSTEM